ncbi:glycosyltransferase family 2 protein [Candidatus Pelagibacter sp. HIMB1542]|uniref:glycosyltransferase family 2 protein n=1 Tax=Candidatus Pelagibacter sp. HIMB1542 TaxID=3413346 RepID=UPI003F8730B9
MKFKKKISIVIPCFNEENTIIEVIENSINSLKKLECLFEIIVIDDFSNDKTRVLLDKLADQKKIKLYYHDKNFGKGKALQTGFKEVTGDYVIIQDADHEYDPREYDKLLIPFLETDADIVYGSRFLGGGKYVRLHFFWHYLANKILTFFCNLVTNINMTDMETGFKAFKTNCLNDLTLEENRFGFEPEFTIKMAKKKFKFYEVAISYRGRTYEQGKKIGLKDAFRALYCILKFTLK